MAQIDSIRFSRDGTNTSDSLTKVFVLHPVAYGLVFSSVITWIIVLVVLAIQFVVFGVHFSFLLSVSGTSDCQNLQILKNQYQLSQERLVCLLFRLSVVTSC
jgi:hypothetical protein